MYKYDTHVHTSEASACARSTGPEMARKYKELGYDGIFVTNHFFNGNTSVDRHLPWDKWVDGYYAGYETAKEEGDKIGLSVFFGFEYHFGEGSEVLVYNLSREYIKEHDEMCRIPANDFINLVHDGGGFIVQAHPFREADYIKMIRLYFDGMDGVEVINTSHKDEKFNERAYWYAKSYNYPMTSGSDSHSTSYIYGGGILVEEPFKCEADYLDALKNGKIRALLGRTEKYIV